MGKKIDYSETESAQLTDSRDLAYLKANGARALPDSPTERGWSAAAIKRQLFMQPEILYAWLKKLAESQLSLAKAIDSYLDALSKGSATPKVYKMVSDANSAYASGFIDIGSLVFVTDGSDLTCMYASGSGLILLGDSLNEFEGRLSSAESEVLNLKKRADSSEDKIDSIEALDSSRHHIITDSEGYVAQTFPSNASGDAPSERLANHSDGVAIKDSIDNVRSAIGALMGIKDGERQLIDKIISGEISAGSSRMANQAYADGDNQRINAASYGSKISLSYAPSSGKITLSLINQNGVELSSQSVDLPTEMVFSDARYDEETKSLVFELAGGGNDVTVPLSDLIDRYVPSEDPAGICEVSVVGNSIGVTIKDGSIPLSKLNSAFIDTINGWTSAEQARVIAEQGRVEAEAQRASAEAARQSDPRFFIDEEGYISINYGSGHDITID